MKTFLRPGNQVTASFGVQLKADNNDSANLDKITTLGLKFVRRGFIWEAIEKEPVVYDFSAYDRLVEDCKTRGLSMIGCLAFSNTLYGHARMEPGRSAYAAWAAEVVKRYKGCNIIWEIWNEPNVCTFWGRHGTHNSEPYADEYLALVRAVVPAVKTADPDCTVVVGAVSGVWSASYAWMAYIFKQGLLKTGIDALSVHPYSTQTPEDYVEAYAKIRGFIKDAGDSEDFPMINTERGYAIGKPTGANPDELLAEMGFRVDGTATPESAAENQAKHLVRQYLIDHMEGLGLTIWYEWTGDEGFNLVREDVAEVPAKKACGVLCRELSGYRYCDRLPMENPRDFVLCFADATGKTKYVAWCAPSTDKPESENQPHEITIPMPHVAQVDVVNMYGAQTIHHTPEKALKITLSGSPVYICAK